ncbi:unnamed protein product [Durusdinium trenchii]|uniref:Chloride channel protein n=1 Tax=Durusdinium trenchii TaxID=1381693 RepID=A0ABP0JPU2_9DINO
MVRIVSEESGKITVPSKCSIGWMCLATLLHGVGSGAVGIFIAHLIRKVQILGFGYDHGGFLEIALESNTWRRMACVLSGGLIGAVAWFWLRGRRVYLVTVEESLKGAKMPPVATLMNAMVQDIVVALGGSFGREAAPREIAAMWGGWVGDAFGVTKEQRKVLVACGAGAGLAAVYSVPISGALYTIEHVLNWDISPSAVLPAIVTSLIATVVTSSTVETHGLYSMPRYSYEWPNWQVCLWALLVGPIAGLGASAFRRFVKFVEGYKPLGRFPVEFHTVKLNDEVWITKDNKDGSIERVLMKVVHIKKNESITVRAAEADEEYGEEEEIREEDWDDSAHAEGGRDWTIFIFMPLAFLVLALLSRNYPSLLGNGRALAEIAMQRQRSTPFLAMLLLLKALMTAAAIGSGAAGGTLTPSVALGATLGAVLGEPVGGEWCVDGGQAETLDFRSAAAAPEFNVADPVAHATGKRVATTSGMKTVFAAESSLNIARRIRNASVPLGCAVEDDAAVTEELSVESMNLSFSRCLMPRRPAWSYEVSSGRLHHREAQAFKQWLTDVQELIQKTGRLSTGLRNQSPSLASTLASPRAVSCGGLCDRCQTSVASFATSVDLPREQHLIVG